MQEKGVYIDVVLAGDLERILKEKRTAEQEEKIRTAYGYHYGAGENKGGRPKKKPMEIIEELQRRYPNGSDFATVDELKAVNPDLALRFQSLQNKANEYFGMSFLKYLRSIGLINDRTVRIIVHDCVII